MVSNIGCVFYSVEFGETRQLLDSDEVVLIQADELNEDNALLLTINGLFTMEPDGSTRPVVSKTEFEDSNVKPDDITSFVQHNASTIIFVEDRAHCLRLLKRTDQSQDIISTMAGNCRSSGSTNGKFDKAKFDEPQTLVNGESSNTYYLTENRDGDGIIRLIQMAEESVTNFYDKEPSNELFWYSMVYMPQRDTLYTSTSTGLSSLDISSKQYSWVVHGGLSAINGPFSSAKIIKNVALASVSNDVIIAVPKSQDDVQLQLIDLKAGSISSMKFKADTLTCVGVDSSRNVIYLGAISGVYILPCEYLLCSLINFKFRLNIFTCYVLLHTLTAYLSIHLCLYFACG